LNHSFRTVFTKNEVADFALLPHSIIEPTIPAIDDSPKLAAIGADLATHVLFVGAKTRGQAFAVDDLQFAGALRQAEIGGLACFSSSVSAPGLPWILRAVQIIDL
jgi:hypothetical protein